MTTTAKLKLFEPFKLGKLGLKNRIVMSPMVTNYGNTDGSVGETTEAYYTARARGGAGLIIIEATSVDLTRNKCWVRQLAIDDDKFIPGFAKLVDGLHACGAKAALQLHHGGNVSRQDLVPLKPVSASSLRYQDSYQLYAEKGEPAEEITPAQIADLVGLYANAAARAQKAGFDAVEIHGATGYLVGQFLSSVKNQRKDRYGGELKDRARFLLEVVAAVRTAVGAEYPVWCKLSSEETGLQGGITFEETKQVVGWLEKLGIFAINISGLPQVRTNYSPPGYFVKFAHEIKKSSKLPVIATGGIDARLAEQVLREDKADLIAIGRAFITDPDWPIKAAEGRWEDIRPCIRDASCRDCIAYKDLPVGCTVNAAAGKERQSAIIPAARPKKIVIIGGGPAGMEAARVAAARGHYVTLFDKGTKLGGQLLLAAAPPGKELIAAFMDYMAAQMKKPGITVKSCKDATLGEIMNVSPDAAIIATGSEPAIPNIPGIASAGAVTVEDVLSGKAKTGKNVIIIGGGTTGCETAHFLAKQGKEATVVEMLDAVASTIKPSTLRTALLEAMSAAGVETLTGVKVEEVRPDGITISHKNGNRQILKADTIVLSVGRKPLNALYEKLKGLVPEVYIIGDAAQPGLIADAVSQGLSIGLKV